MASTVHCPICKKLVAVDNPNMPFCSDHCREVDLGNWATEKYVISTPTYQSDLEELDRPERPEGLER